jgi:DNA-binding response OmpR family regulator
MSSRVLVLDDSPVLVELTTKSLLAAGVEASGALDLAALDQQLAGNDFDLILVDVKMPEAFGDDVLDFLRSQRKVQSKLVLYSDLPETELAQKARDCAADGYICKGKGLENAVADVLRMLQGADAGVKALPTGQHARRSSAKKRRVLVVDDSELTARWVERELPSEGFEINSASSVEKATKIILKKKTRPDVVLLNAKLPKANRDQLCRFIKGNSLFAGIKVLFCSSDGVDELKRICRESGADGYVAKDAPLGALLARELG